MTPTELMQQKDIATLSRDAIKPLVHTMIEAHLNSDHADCHDACNTFITQHLQEKACGDLDAFKAALNHFMQHELMGFFSHSPLHEPLAELHRQLPDSKTLLKREVTTLLEELKDLPEKNRVLTEQLHRAQAQCQKLASKKKTLQAPQKATQAVASQTDIATLSRDAIKPRVHTLIEAHLNSDHADCQDACKAFISEHLKEKTCDDLDAFKTHLSHFIRNELMGFFSKSALHDPLAELHGQLPDSKTLLKREKTMFYWQLKTLPNENKKLAEKIDRAQEACKQLASDNKPLPTPLKTTHTVAQKPILFTQAAAAPPPKPTAQPSPRKKGKNTLDPRQPIGSVAAFSKP